MKTLYATVIALLITGTQALASGGGGDGESMSLLATFFIAFAVMVVLFQFIPGLMLFGGMLAALFKSSEKKSDEAVPVINKTT
jgi:hypothetical protein